MQIISAGTISSNSRSRLLLGASLLTFIFAPTEGRGQTIPSSIPAPPENVAIDAQSVDLIRGKFIYPIPLASIGPDDGGISYQATVDGNYYTDNWSGVLYVRPESDGVFIYISYQNKLYRFRRNSPSSFTETSDSKSTLSYANYTYTMTDRLGTKFIFPDGLNSGLRLNYPCLEMDATECSMLESIEKPNGIKYRFSWEYVTRCINYCIDPNSTYQARLISVESSLGYKLKYTYEADNFTSNAPSPAWVRQTKREIYNLADCAEPSSCTNVLSPEIGPGYPFLSVVTAKDANGDQYSVSYSGDQIKIKEPGYADFNVTVSRSGGFVTSVNRSGKIWAYQYSRAGNVATMTVTDPNSNVKVYESNLTISKIVRSVDGAGRVTRYKYDEHGWLTHVILPEGTMSGDNPVGGYIKYSYDPRGNVTETRHVSKTPGTPPDIVSSAGYSATCGNPVVCNLPNWVKDPLGNQTDYTYDPTHGGVLTESKPAAVAGGVRPQTRYTYAARQAYFNRGAGIVASGDNTFRLTGISTCLSGASCSGSANESKTAVDYGPQVAGTKNNLLPVTVTRSAGDGSISAQTTLSYDSVGNLTSQDGPLAGAEDKTAYLYDGMRRTVGIVGPDPDGAGGRKNAASRITYDTQGRVTLNEQGYTSGQTLAAWSGFTPGASIATSYDVLGQKSTEALKNGATTYTLTQYGYDNAGRVQCVTQRMNPAGYNSLPGACTLQSGGTADRIVRYTYDSADQVTQVQSAYGTAQQSTEVIGYTGNGQTAYVVDANSNRTTYEYDGLDRLVKSRYPVSTKGADSSSTSDYEQLTYADNVHITQRRLRDGSTIAISYDKLDRVTGISGTTIPARTFSYNLLGMQTGASFTSGGQSVTNAFDAFGRVISQTTPQGAVSYQYDAASRRTRIIWPDSFFVTYGYDVAGNITAIRESGVTSGVQVLASYGYDDLGRRTAVTYGNGASRSYAYDSIDRLAGLKIDPVGTVNDLVIGGVAGAGTPISYNPASQITSIARSNDAYAWTGHYNFDRNYTTNGLNQYTASGVTALGYDGRGNLTSSGGTTYGYNGLNQLTSVSGGNAGTLSYDPIDRLYQLSSAGVTTRYLYDGVNMIGEYNGSNALLRRFVPGPGIDEPIVWYEGSGTTNRRWLQGDERGSIVTVLDSSGAAIGLNRYDEYGIPQSSNSGRFQYTGQVWLGEVGLYYYKARFYSPTLGRFMQTDPIGYGDGMNWYNYVGGDPINKTDPLGLEEGGGEIVVTAPRPFQWGSILNAGPAMVRMDPFAELARRLGVRTSAPPELQNVASNNANTFCGNPTPGRTNPYFPNGRVNTGKTGNRMTAGADLNAIAAMNGIEPPSNINNPIGTTRSAMRSSTPVPVGFGWTLHRNPKSGQYVFANGGLAMRWDSTSSIVRLDIPQGFYVPGVSGRLATTETCHYRP